MKNIIVTTSWDDGHKLNLKLAKLLNKYGVRATFYLAKQQDELGQPESEIKQITQMHEIGAHTLTHPDNFLELSEAAVIKEIAGSKKWLEDLLGQEVKMFCYPRGLNNLLVAKLVEDAGFIGARTVGVFNYQTPKNRFSWDPTIHIYPFPFRRRSAKKLHWSRHLLDPFWQHLPMLVKWRLPIRAYFSWLEMAKASFDYAKKHGQVWHLWGHCFELEKYQMWEDLEKLLQYITSQKEVEFLTNSEVIERCLIKK